MWLEARQSAKRLGYGRAGVELGNETLEKLEEKKLTQQASNRAEKGRKERKGRF